MISRKIFRQMEWQPFADASATDAGVTVSAQQSITDNYYTYLSFKVEGYRLEDGKQPDFENVSVTVDGKQDFSSGSSFYSGISFRTMMEWPCMQMDQPWKLQDRWKVLLNTM